MIAGRLTLGVLAAALLWAGPSASLAQAAPAKQAAATVRLRVEGMTCEGCAMNVTNSLKKTKGVRSTKVTVAQQLATVQYDPAVVKPDELVTVVRKAGYQTKVVK